MPKSAVKESIVWLPDENVDWIINKLGSNAVPEARKLAESFYKQNKKLLVDERGDGHQIELQIVSICTYPKYNDYSPVCVVSIAGNTLTLLCRKILVLAYLPFEPSSAFKNKMIEAAGTFNQSFVVPRPQYRTTSETIHQSA